MQRFLGLCLVLFLAACQTLPGPGENPGETPGGGEPLTCNDAQHDEVFNSMPIEFGQAYEVTNEVTYFTTTQSVPGGTALSIRLDNVPNNGLIGYRVEPVGGGGFADSFNDIEETIPATIIGSGVTLEEGQVTVRISYIDPNYQENGCARFQFMLNRE